MTSTRSRHARRARRQHRRSAAHHRPHPDGTTASDGSLAAAIPTSATLPRRDASDRSGILAFLAAHWQIAGVLALFALSALIVPTMTPAPVGDDWVYAISVERLVQDGVVDILDLSVTTLVFQVAWGSLFALFLGDGFGPLRLSTVVLVFLSGVAFYGLLRELGVSRQRSAIGTTAYLFNPLTYSLAFSFMTDPHFCATMVISVAFYARGLRPDRPSRSALLLGSLAAGLAFLVRQQGALIPFGVVAYLVVTRQLRFDRASVVRFLEVVAIPATMTVLYYLWLFFIHGVPYQQESFLNQIRLAGIEGSWRLLRQMTYIEVAYVGFFVFPITVAALAGWRALVPGGPWFRLAALSGWLVIIVAGLVVFGDEGRLMPYIPQFVGTHGLGPTDLWGGRAGPLDPETTMDVRRLLTWLCAGSAVLFGLATLGRLGVAPSPERSVAGMVAMVGFWQVVGVMPPSYHFRNWIISVDRYLLPLLPFAIALLLWSLRGVRLWTPLAWVVLGFYAVFSVGGTRDFLVFQEATWETARYANTFLDVPLTKLDGGSSWDGYYLYDYSDRYGIPQQTVSGPWWTNLFATATDSTYVVSSSPSSPAGYVEVARFEYSSWLRDDPTYLYVLQRVVPPPVPPPLPPDIPPPPTIAGPVGS